MYIGGEISLPLSGVAGVFEELLSIVSMVGPLLFWGRIGPLVVTWLPVF